MSHAPICLILGSGPGVGSAVAQRFHAQGYRVAEVSRRGSASADADDSSRLIIQADLTDTSAHACIYRRVQDVFGGSPSVVVYNASGSSPPADERDLFSVPLESFRRDQDVMVTGAYVAAGEAVKRWKEGEGDGDGGREKVFFYTGNMLAKAVAPMPQFLSLGTGKSGAHFFLKMADLMYRDKGMRFIYADQRVEGGLPASNGTDPEAHAELYTRIAKDPAAFPFYVQFVDGTKVEVFDDAKIARDAFGVVA
ncbi:hypothetical protein F5Y15DRAFT_259209 [Xylariaceae sp. FL0016]|nr:hypothetical protein F5Y15DRAFT_259209 [Xylariaceae sp. FL0016]